jgi:predicted RNA-binding Zn ribbon-like protein
MKQTWNEMTDWYELAPPGLQLTQQVVNSIPRTPESIDPLDDVENAQGWLEVLVERWAAVHGGAVPEITVTARGLTRARRLRSAIHDALTRESAPCLTAAIDVSIEGDQVAIVPKGSDGNWLESAISAELLLAQQDDTLRRLKLCRNPLCQSAFFDRSKNNSKVWHDTAKCGAPAYMREYRKRLQQTGN